MGVRRKSWAKSDLKTVVGILVLVLETDLAVLKAYLTMFRDHA